MPSGNLDSSGHTLSSNSLKKLEKHYTFECTSHIPWMHLLKITDFFETDLLYNFYSINDKDMSLGNLDSCHHTQSNNSWEN